LAFLVCERQVWYQPGEQVKSHRWEKKTPQSKGANRRVLLLRHFHSTHKNKQDKNLIVGDKTVPIASGKRGEGETKKTSIGGVKSRIGL